MLVLNNSKDRSNINFALNLFLCLCLSLRKSGVKWCVCTFPLGIASSWTCYRRSVQHSVPDGTQSSCSSCLFWKLDGGQQCHGVPRSVVALMICRIAKGGNTRTSELLLGIWQIDTHCPSEPEEMVKEMVLQWLPFKIAASLFCMQKDLQ